MKKLKTTLVMDSVPPLRDNSGICSRILITPRQPRSVKFMSLIMSVVAIVAPVLQIMFIIATILSQNKS